MDKQLAKIIANLLNGRGFILDEDISEIPVSYTKFSDWIKENEDVIRDQGYFGGPLKAWTTGFRGSGCAYGVIDSNSAPTDDWIDEYCMVTNDIESSRVTASNLRKYCLGLTYTCDCGHACNKAPSEIPQKHDKCHVYEITGQCSGCGKKQIRPSEAYKPWK